MADIEKIEKALNICKTGRCRDDLGNNCPYLREKRCTTTVVEDALKLLKEQDAVEPKWTSVKERYPEEEGFYLVSADHGNYLPWIAEMKIFCGVKGFCNGAVMPCVGAWMPLPEPYNRTD